MGGETRDLGIPGISSAQEIGRGGFGIVYRSRQDAFDRTVAVKVLNLPDIDDDAIRRFERELLAVGALSGHPSIVSVHSHGTMPDGQPYLVMEFCEGGSYGDALRQRGSLGWDDATAVAVSIAGALETAHRAGILHRDVKPDNLLLDAYGSPKLTDFGIARINTQASTTRTGALTGSPAHVSPELVAGEGPTPASDVYSLASTVHALITGQAPFQRDDDTTILPLLNRILNEPPPDLRPMGVPEPVWAVLEQGMVKDPGGRYPTAMEFGRALAAARAQLGLAEGELRVMGETTPKPPPTPLAEQTIIGAVGSAPTPSPDRGWADPTPGVSVPPKVADGSSPGTAGGSGTPPPHAGPGDLAPPPPPASAPPRSRTPLVLGIAAAVLVLVGIVGFALAGGGDDDDDDERVSNTIDRTTTEPDDTEPDDTEPDDTEPDDTEPPPPVDPSALLFPLAELPQYGPGDPALTADIDPAEGFCNQVLDTSALEDIAVDAYQASEFGPFVSTSVAVFATAEDAIAYANATAGTVACDSWIDSDGLTNSVVYVPVSTVADGTDGYTQYVDSPNGILEGDISLVREGRVIVSIANIGFSPIDKDFSDFLTVRQAELLVAG